MATSLLFGNELSFDSLPATAALEEAKRRMCALKRVNKQGEAVSSPKANSQFSRSLCSIEFDKDAEPFPTIEWSSDDDCSSESGSERSLDEWNSFLSDFETGTSLGKRGRGEARRLVRSKKIKSNLSSLAN